MKEDTMLYNSEHCPCPSDCKRRGKCKECIAFHHARGEQTFCEYLDQREKSAPPPEEVPAKSGREIRLLAYGPCAG